MPKKTITPSRLGAVGALMLGVVAVVFLATNGSALDRWLAPIGAWSVNLGFAGMLIFALVGGVSVVFFFPGSVFMTASGAAFGLGAGFVTAQLGATFGAGLAFLVSRHLARRRVEGWVRSRPHFAAVDEAVGRQGWKIVLWTRCCPLFPYIFQNFAYGLTSIGFRPYAWGSFLGLAPATLVFAYVGSLGRAGAEAASGQASGLDISLKLAGFVATIGVSVYLTRLSRRALDRAGV